MERIAEVDLLIGDAERAVAHQMTEIERLHLEGHDTTKPEELLRAFRRTLEALQNHRQRILKSAACKSTSGLIAHAPRTTDQGGD